MRNTKTITLSDDCTVVIRELTPNIVRNGLLAGISAGDVTFQTLIGDRYDELLGVLGDSIEVQSSGAEEGNSSAFGDLSFSEVTTVKEAFMEINEPFFALVGNVLPSVTDLMSVQAPPETPETPETPDKSAT